MFKYQFKPKTPKSKKKKLYKTNTLTEKINFCSVSWFKVRLAKSKSKTLQF